jgi:hypothetical protein
MDFTGIITAANARQFSGMLTDALAWAQSNLDENTIAAQLKDSYGDLYPPATYAAIARQSTENAFDKEINMFRNSKEVQKIARDNNLDVEELVSVLAPRLFGINIRDGQIELEGAGEGAGGTVEVGSDLTTVNKYMTGAASLLGSGINVSDPVYKEVLGNLVEATSAPRRWLEMESGPPALVYPMFDEAAGTGKPIRYGDRIWYVQSKTRTTECFQVGDEAASVYCQFQHTFR